MKFITEPEVYLISRSTIDNSELQRFLEDEGIVAWETDAVKSPEKIVEVGGRVCYMSFIKGRKTNQEYIENLLSSGHGSVLEHVVWTFIVTGVSRGFSHEMVRHRVGFSYSQRSTRYVDEAEGNFVIPPLIQRFPDLEEKLKTWYQEDQERYVWLVEELLKRVPKIYPKLSKTDLRKLCRGAARCKLPIGLETKIVITSNARGFRHFVEMRANQAAELEIRKVAIKILRILQKEAPNIFSDYEIKILQDGSEVVKTEYKKV